MYFLTFSVWHHIKGQSLETDIFFMFIPFQSVLSTFVLMGLRIVAKLIL